MFESVWQFVQHQLATNQFFSGGLVLMLVGGLAAYFRALRDRLALPEANILIEPRAASTASR